MKQFFFSALFMFVAVCASFAQTTTILDFQAPSTSTTFQYFGSPQDGSLNEVVANPSATGINTSSLVSKYVKPAVAQTWAGAFTNPNPITACNMTVNGKIKMKVYMDHIGPVALKLEGSPTGTPWILTQSNTVINQWEELTFDVSLPSIEGGNTATGHTYARVVVFFDFGIPGTGTDVTSYFDDIRTEPGEVIVSVPYIRFQTVANTVGFTYFGSSLNGSNTTVVNNPSATGINPSTKVARFVKPAGAETWAGASSGSNPQAFLDFTTLGKVKVKVRMDHIGSLSIKLENSTNGGANWLGTQANTTINQWEELTFDISQPSQEAPGLSAAGKTYTRIVLFFDFGTPGGASDVVSFFDDIRTTAGDPIPTTTKLDFETPNTTSGFFNFGSSLDGSVSQPINNPFPGGINTSSKVQSHTKPVGAQPWAGAFSNTTNPKLNLDMQANQMIKVKVRLDQVGSVSMKLEGSTNGGPEWITTQPVNVANEWVELTFNAATPGFEGAMQPATGYKYSRVVLFFNFGTAGGATDVTSYFDDIQAFPTPGCVTPTGAVVTLQSATTAAITFPAINGASKYGLGFRLAGTTTWSSASSAGPFFNLTGLMPNSTYEYRLRSFCSQNQSWTTWSPVSTFATNAGAAACTVPVLGGSYTASNTSRKAYWNFVQGAVSYQVRIQATDLSSAMQTFTTPNTFRVFTGLVPGKAYTWAVRTRCAGNVFTAWSANGTFTMPQVNSLVMEENNEIASNDVQTLNRVVLSPNPARSILNLEYNETPQSIKVFSLSGSQMPAVQNDATNINLDNYATGMYFLLFVHADGTSETIRFEKL